MLVCGSRSISALLRTRAHLGTKAPVAESEDVQADTHCTEQSHDPRIAESPCRDLLPSWLRVDCAIRSIAGLTRKQSYPTVPHRAGGTLTGASL